MFFRIANVDGRERKYFNFANENVFKMKTYGLKPFKIHFRLDLSGNLVEKFL